ncbi:MAG: hypothetical protein IKM43_02315 [Clostridia bacterium]|nr:hypothetical protein [Clostridia bacterium]
MTKVNSLNWAQLDFLINNFYEIVEYKRGRGIYGDRVILKRPRRAESILGEPDRLVEFYYMDANAVKELPMTVSLRIKNIIQFVTSPEHMNVLCEFSSEIDPAEWALVTSETFANAKTIDFEILNNILIERYKLLDGKFLSKLNKHREKQYFLASSDTFNLISKDYANKQVTRL